VQALVTNRGLLNYRGPRFGGLVPNLDSVLGDALTQEDGLLQDRTSGVKGDARSRLEPARRGFGQLPDSDRGDCTKSSVIQNSNLHFLGRATEASKGMKGRSSRPLVQVFGGLKRTCWAECQI
jgi:hypothetical protein